MTLTLAELMDIPCIMEAVNVGRKHANEDISTCAKNLRKHWKELAAAPTAPTAVAAPVDATEV